MTRYILRIHSYYSYSKYDYDILRVAKLGQFFNDGASGKNPLDLDGTRVSTGATRTHFIFIYGITQST